MKIKLLNGPEVDIDEWDYNEEPEIRSQEEVTAIVNRFLEFEGGCLDQIPVWLVGSANGDTQYYDEILSRVEDWIFLCDVCGWWCNMGEESSEEPGELVCSECDGGS